nr:cytochrome-c peroxidase [Deltaproteobacteria bacterium]
MQTRWLVLVALSGCVEPAGGPGVDAPVDLEPPRTEALPLAAPDPANNPRTPAKIALGRLLFWDPVLSGDRDVACATCHDPAFGYADPRASSTTVGGRNSMTVLNAAWNGAVAGHTQPDCEQAPMFWDNRARSLEQQARGPLMAADEMMGDRYTAATILPELIARLQAIPDYVARFEAVYGAGQINETTIL